jgi:hypothetical protein
MATASTLMTERRGRCNRLAKISLFMFAPDSGRQKNAAKSGFRVTDSG